MIRIISILLLISGVTQAQNLRKWGSTGSTSTLYGDFFYLAHPTYGLSDSLKLADKKYVDAALASIGASSAYGIDSTVIGGTAGSILYVASGPVLAQNNSLLNWNNSTSTLTTGTILPGAASTYNLGAPATRYSNLWVNGLNLNTGGTASANNIWMQPGAVIAVTQTPSATGQAIMNFQTSASAATSGNTYFMSVQVAPFQPTSGTGRFATFFLHNVINQTGGANGVTRGIFDSTRLTSAADYRAYENAFGTVFLNSVSGSTGVGALPGARKFYVRGSIGMHPDSCETIPSLGSDYVQVIDASTGKFKKITGANLGVGGSSDGNGIYGGSGSLTENTDVSGGGTFSLNLGTSGSKLSSLSANSAATISLTASTYVQLFGGIQIGSQSATDADYTIPDNISYINLPEITASRTVTLPNQGAGKMYIIHNKNTSGNAWNVSGNLVDAAGASITTLTNSTVYLIISDGSNFIRIN